MTIWIQAIVWDKHDSTAKDAMSGIYKDFTDDHKKENLMMEWDLSTKDLGKSATYEDKVDEFDFETAATKESLARTQTTHA
jgi:hypothetical protein